MENKNEIPAIPGMNGITDYVIEEAMSGFWVRGKHSISRSCVAIVEKHFGEGTGFCSLDGHPAFLITYLLKDYAEYPEA